jgi:4-amino-4-deoxy-L-arabinose transferase-like glycosyltransferase
MKNYFFEKLKSVSLTAWILIAILLIGVFLRTYHFNDWLQFGPDQARDATLIGDAVNNKAPVPLIGPQSGNTTFSLGPWYYELEYVSAKIFGNAPDKMAYPDVFFSILAILLLYLFLREYFSKNVSLSLAFLMSISYFCILNSRFASNPNSIPFFVLLFLYSALRLISANDKKYWFWSAILGIALGVSIQLHTLLFVSLPIITVLIFLYLLKNRKLKAGMIAMVILFFAFTNIGQIIHEVEFSFSNSISFFRESSKSSGKKSDIFRNFVYISACQLEANTQIIFPIEKRESCDLFKFKKHMDAQVKNYQTLEIAALILFSVGGYLIMIFNLSKEKDDRKKNFLRLILIYNLLSFLILIPVANQISVRYYIILSFVPFVLLGVWMEKIFLIKVKKTKAIILSAILILISALSNAYVLKSSYAKYNRGMAIDGRNSVLGEIIPIADFISDNVGVKKQIYFDGDRDYFSRFFKPLQYLVASRGIITGRLQSAQDDDAVVAYISSSNKKKKNQNQIGGRTVERYKKFNKVTIYILN